MGREKRRGTGAMLLVVLVRRVVVRFGDGMKLGVNR
jgi:hypothetical protein